jgi:hypothetical protein
MGTWLVCFTFVQRLVDMVVVVNYQKFRAVTHMVECLDSGLMDLYHG